MATRIIFMNYLERIGFPVAIRDALVVQGVETITGLLGMDDDDVDDLCSNIRKPGGMMPNPARNTNPRAPAFVPNLGTAVGRIHQERLKQIAYYYSYLNIVNRTFDPQHATVEELVRLWEYKKNLEGIKESKKDGEDKYPEKFTNSKSSREFIESVENWIDDHYGVKDIPLAYVIREDDEVPDDDNDPLPLGQDTFDDELIRRASHSGELWAANNAKVWQMIRHVTHGTDAWAFVKSFARAQNGREAYYALKTHYMGADFVNKVKLNADAQLETLHWNGRARNFTWDKFVSRLTSAFADLAENGEEKSESEKVRKLLRAITDPTLSVAKAVIQGDRRYAEDYQAACAYLAGQLSSAEAMNANNKRNVSQVARAERGGRSRGRFVRGGRPHQSGNDRGSGRGRDTGRARGRGRMMYSRSGHLLSNGGYPREIWNSFSGEEKSQVYRMREQREAETRRTAAAMTRDNENNRHDNTGEENNRNNVPGIGPTMTRRES
jgi:hypothetical protein